MLTEEQIRDRKAHEGALEAMTRQLIFEAARWAFLEGNITRADYPDIGEHDWETLLTLVDATTSMYLDDHDVEFDAAYDHLSSLAEKDEPGGESE